MNTMSKGNRRITRILVLALAVMVGAAFSLGVTSAEVDAAVKKPAKVKNVKVVDKTYSTIKVQWKKQGKVSGVKVKYTVKYKEASAEKWSSKRTAKNTLTLKSLKPGTSYKIKVNGYIKKNGKTYKGKVSKVISAKTKVATIEAGDAVVEVSDGQTIAIPSPNGGKGYTVKNATVVTDNNGEITIEGTTAEGLSFYCGADERGITYLSVGDKGKYDGVGGPGYNVEIKGTNGATVYWTCDGTEPKVGQEELVGKCRYTRNTYTYYMKALQGGYIEPLKDGYFETTLRGVTKPGETDIMLDGCRSTNDERVRWFKAYKNGKLVAEWFQHINRGGYAEKRPNDYDPEQMKQVCIDAIKELDRFDEEYWGPEPL